MNSGYICIIRVNQMFNSAKDFILFAEWAKREGHLEEVEAGVVAGALAVERSDCDGWHVALRRVDHPDAEREVRVAARVVGRRDAPCPARALHVPVAAAP